MQLDYSTYLGGSNDFDKVYAIALDSVKCAYVTGITNSTDFPTVNPYQSTHSGPTYDTNAFITKLSSTGSYLM